jgi:hypothetical protein
MEEAKKEVAVTLKETTVESRGKSPRKTQG